jgi:hypothetical protein
LAVAGVLGVVLASGASAQQPVLDPITETLGAGATPYVRWLTAAFDSIPESKYGFRPTAPQQTIGYIAQHLENANYHLCAKFGDMPYRMTAKDSLADTIKAKWPKDTLTARLKASFDFCRTAFFTLTDRNLLDSLPAFAGFPPPKYPRVRYVAGFMTDVAEHWAQVASYMRLLGMVPASAQK